MKPTRFALLAVAALVPTFWACEETPLNPESQSEVPALARQGADPTAASNDTYILTAGRWTSRQTRAVEMAGGAVIFSNEGDGVAVATSESPAFFAEMSRSSAISGVARDVLVKGVAPVQVAPFERSREPLPAQSFDPTNETFFAYQWNMAAIAAPQAWAAECTGAGARIAVLDGGISSGHVDIAPNLDVAASTSFVPGYAFDEDIDDDFAPPGDGPFRHASHVAGIAAAPANGIGTIGVAPEATIVAVKVLNGGSGYFSWILQGIYYAAMPQSEGGAGADIINMSLGGTLPKNAEGAGLLVAAFNQALSTAARKGVLVVSAAGNDYADLDHNGNLIVLPGEAANGIAVSATAPYGWILGADDVRSPASYTNFGNSAIHVAAPGGDFDYPAYPIYLYDMVLSPGEGTDVYYFAAGTSMSAPHVAGLAALIVGRHPDMSVGQLKTLIARTADDAGKPGHDPYYGNGFINAQEACSY